MKCKILFVFMLLLGIVALAHGQITLIGEDFEDGPWPRDDWDVGTTTLTTQYALSYNHSIMFDNVNDVLRTPLVHGPTYMSFYHRWLSSYDPTQFWVQISIENSGIWTDLGHYWAGPPWTNQQIDLASYWNKNVYIRFVLQNTNPSPDCVTRLYVDDILIQKCPFVPVELASFTANLEQVDNQDIVKLHWTTQSETMVSGYNVFKHSTPTVSSAMQINPALISASNTSTTSNYEFMDDEVETGMWYYWLQSNDMDGSVQLFGPISITIGAENDQGQTPGLGTQTMLKNAYPNPFQISTVIPFQLTSKGNVSLEIYNQKGQRVWSYDKSNADVGMYQVEWDGKDMNGRRLGAGVYLCRMSSENHISSKKLVILK